MSRKNTAEPHTDKSDNDKNQHARNRLGGRIICAYHIRNE